MKDLSRSLYKSKSLRHFTHESMVDTLNSQRDLNASFVYEKQKQKEKTIKQQQKRDYLRKLLAKKFRLIYNVIRLLYHHDRVILEKHEEMKKKINYIIQPNDKIKRIWDFVMLFTYLETAIYLPLRISFIKVLELDILNDIIFAINIIFILRSSFYNRQNILISDQWQIIKDYMKGWMILDIITLIPIDDYLGWSVSYQKFPRFLRVFSINTILRGSLFHQQTHQTLLNTYQINIMRIIIRFIYGIHLFTCLWYLAEQLNNSYINCLFWALQTFSTIGYGNDAPKNQAQYLVAIIWMFLGASFYGVVLLNLGEWLKKIDSDSIHNEMHNNLREFFTQVRVVDEVKSQIYQYISLNVRLNQTWSLGLQDWFQDLPIQRQKDITLCISYQEMMGIHFFRLNLNFSVQILPKMMLMKVEQNGKLFIKNEGVNEIFFLMKGRVQYRTQFGKSLLIIEQGAILGEQEYFKNGKLSRLKYRQNYAIATEDCQFIVLDGDFFIDQLCCFPSLLKYLGIIAQQREQFMKMQIIQNKLERERERMKEQRLQQIKETYQIDVIQYEGMIKPQKSVIYDTQQTRTQQVLEQLIHNRRSRISKLYCQFRKVVQMIIFANRLIQQQTSKIHPFLQQQSQTTFKTTESRGQKSIEKSIILKYIHTKRIKTRNTQKIRIQKNKRTLDYMFRIKNEQSFKDSIIENDDYQNYEQKLQIVVANCIKLKQMKKMIIKLQKLLDRQKEELEDDLISVSNWIGNLELQK